MDRLIELIIPLSIIGLISLIVGILLGLLLASLRLSVEQDRSKNSRSLKEIFRFYRDRRVGNIVLEINGKIYRKSDNLSTKVHTGLVQLCDEMRIWLGVPEIGDRVQSISPEKVSTIQKAQIKSNIERIDEQSDNLARSPVVARTDSEKLIDVQNRVLSPENQPVNESSSSIATQVDEILQQKLPNSSLKDRVITLLELPDKGLVVVVDSEQYESVDDVPEIEVRELIRESVLEWEKKTGAG